MEPLSHIYWGKNNPSSTWTLCSSALADAGMRAGQVITLEALVSFTNVACRDNKEINLRLYESYLGLRVEVDESAKPMGIF